MEFGRQNFMATLSDIAARAINCGAPEDRDVNRPHQSHASELNMALFHLMSTWLDHDSIVVN